MLHDCVPTIVPEGKWRPMISEPSLSCGGVNGRHCGLENLNIMLIWRSWNRIKNEQRAHVDQSQHNLIEYILEERDICFV